jgi:hypothetical protein
MNLNALHRRLLQDVLEIGNAFPFVITGGYAVQAHGLVDRLSRDIDVATNSSIPMASLADHLVAGLIGRGWQVRVIGVDPISARFMVTRQREDLVSWRTAGRGHSRGFKSAQSASLNMTPLGVSLLGAIA